MSTKPEDVGLSSERLARIDRHLQERYIQPGKIAGAVTLVARHGQVAHLSALGLTRSRAQAADDRGHRLPHLLDDEADHLDRADEAGRGGALRADRPRTPLHPRVGAPARVPLRRLAHVRDRPAAAPDDHPRPLDPYLGPHLRLHAARRRGRAYRQIGVSGAAPGDPRRRRSRRWSTSSPAAADILAGHALELLGGHRHRRLPGGAHLGPAPRRVPPRADLRAARHARHRLSPCQRGRPSASPRTTRSPPTARSPGRRPR